MKRTNGNFNGLLDGKHQQQQHGIFREIFSNRQIFTEKIGWHEVKFLSLDCVSKNVWYQYLILIGIETTKHFARRWMTFYSDMFPRWDLFQRTYNFDSHWLAMSPFSCQVQAPPSTQHRRPKRLNKMSYVLIRSKRKISKGGFWFNFVVFVCNYELTPQR